MIRRLIPILSLLLLRTSGVIGADPAVPTLDQPYRFESIAYDNESETPVDVAPREKRVCLCVTDVTAPLSPVCETPMRRPLARSSARR